MNTEQRIIKLLQEGKSQAEIAVVFTDEGVKPSSLSSIEKALKGIRAKHGAATMFHLGFILANKK